MPGRLRRVLADSEVELSDEELLDVLWLAARLPQDEAPLVRALRHAHSAPPGLSEEHPPSAADGAGTPPDPPSLPSEDASQRPGEPLHASGTRGASSLEARSRPGLSAQSVRAPGKKSLGTDELRLGRALRPLKQRLPDLRRQELDETRTVTAMAETGLPDPVLRPARTRWLSLALLVDDGVSMLLWQRLASELRALLERSGAFRGLRVYGLDSRGPKAPVLRGRPYSDDGVPLPPSIVNDPTGNTLVLIVSDGVGMAWQDGRMGKAARAWARQGPTAIVHALPTRLWQGSGIRAQQWQVTTRHRGGPTTAWQVTDPVLPADLVSYESVPVPVLEPEPTAVGLWARVVASPGTTVTLPLLADGALPAARPYADTRQTDTRDAVLRFRHAASPEAYRLAAHLAAVAPVSVPVMRLVQAALGPPTDIGHLAEVLLGGLMRRADPADPAQPARHRAFDFSEEARQILLGTVPAHELLRNTAAITDQLGRLIGRSPDFPAWLAHPDGPDRLSDDSRPFTWLDTRLTTRLGVRPTATRPLAESESTSEARSVVPHTPPAAHDPRLVQGRYRLLDLIGRGGMGEVWRARDESLGRHVAVKRLKPLGPSHDQSFIRVLRERFRREARVAAALQHRGVTVVHDFGESDGILYLVMELLKGRNLSRLLKDHEEHRLPIAEVEEIAEQTAKALAYAHAQGIVHRDLKPANIMRLTDGTVKICDFGIARLGRDIGFTSRLTGTGITMGTPHYMSPEQIGGSEVDQRSDLYSLGCVLYEIATGVPPFDLDDAWAVLVGHRDTPPRPPRSLRPDMPEYLDRLILDLLAKQPEHRPHDADELSHRIRVGRTMPASVQSAEDESASDAPRLPSWARGMTAGHQAMSTEPGATPPDDTREISRQWTSGQTPHPVRHPVPAGRQSATAERLTPSPEALTTLTGRHNTGLSLGRLGRWSEAGEVHRAVAAEREHLLGPDHPDTLGSRYEVAFTLSRTGRPADALTEYTHVARSRERLLGPDHPDTLAARQEMAYVLGQLGRHFEAHEVYTSVLAARERTMGSDHPDTLRCRHNLAFNLSRLGRLEDSYRMACDVAAARARVLGPAHPDTLVTRYEVAYALGQLGRWAEALQTYREVAEARAQALGTDHPDTLGARYEVGISLGRLGRSTEALQLYRDLIDDRTRVHGPDHPETLRARHGLGVNLGRLGRWEEALAESRDVYAIRESALGPDHPDTLVSRREVAVGLGWLGRWADALTEYRRVAAARERVLGADHPDTLASRNDEGHCLEQLGRGEEAVELYRQVAALRRQGHSA